MHPKSISHGALKTEAEHRRDICVVGRWIRDRGYVASTDGNISVRLGPDRVLISPTGISKGMMKPDDLVVIDLRWAQGKRAAEAVVGIRDAPSDLPPAAGRQCRLPRASTHRDGLRGRWHCRSIKPILCELVIGLGEIPLARYGTPGTPELSAAIEPFIHGHDAILMANHGVVTYGPDLLTAFFRMETTEHFAQVSLVTERLGKQVVLSGGDVEKLAAARTRYAAGAKASQASAAGAADVPPKASR